MATPTRSVLLEFPIEIYERLHEIAQERNRPVEVVALELLVPTLESPADDVDALLEAMHTYTDEALWDAVYQRLTDKQRQRYDALLEQSRQGALSPVETAEMDALLETIDRQMLLRSEALALLVERGYDVQSRFVDGEWVRM